MLYLLHTQRTLCLTSAGRLLPWLGPALRGLAARRFKESVCRFPLAEQQTPWLHCKGCPHMSACPYGQTLEADPPPSAHSFAGQDDGARPVVLAPDFPVPPQARPGMAVPVRMTLVGSTAAANAARLWDVIAEAGREGGLGDDRIGFRLEQAGPDRWRLLDLPRDPDAVAGTLPAVRVELTSPLLLRQGASEGRRRQMIVEPTFADLLRAGLRTLGALCRGYGQALDADFAGLREAAERVPLLAAEYRSFRQGKWSARSQQHGLMQGVTGSAVFGPVPAALVRWLVAAGRVHVGLHRVAGAGGWRVAPAMERPGEAVAWHEID